MLRLTNYNVKLKNKPFTILILGGLLRKKPDNTWRTGNFNYLRILAGYHLYKKLSKTNKINLVVSGGKGIYKHIPGIPTVSSVMKKELIKLGLKPKEINEENKSGTTYQELMWLSKSYKKNWGIILIVSNSYHLPRIKTMLNKINKIKKLKKVAKLISAEKIMSEYGIKWNKKIEKMYTTDTMKKIIEMEKRGIADTKSGKYKFK